MLDIFGISSVDDSAETYWEEVERNRQDDDGK